MRLIDADALKLADFQDFSNTDVFNAIDDMPIIKIVQCKDCYKRNKSWCPAPDWTLPRDDDFCSYGEQRGGEENEIT